LAAGFERERRCAYTFTRPTYGTAGVSVKTFGFLAALTVAIQTDEPLLGENAQSQAGLMTSWLILLAMAQASFCAAFSATMAASRRGAFTDLPSIPMSAPERVAALALNGMGCGYWAGICVILAIAPIAPIRVAHAGYFAAHAFSTCLMMALLGTLCAFRARGSTNPAILDGAVAVSLAFLPAILFPFGEFSLV
jgi:hypothetical protein